MKSFDFRGAGRFIPRVMKPKTLQKIRKVVFPVGGLGTRFLPATKALPKEMLPVVDKPIIQYAFEEACAAGIEQFIFITGRNKNAISNHFDHSFELQNLLSQQKKDQALELTRGWLPPAGSIMFARQQEALGLGHAIWCARHMIGDEPFAVILADDMVLAGKPCLAQMVDAYSKIGGNMLAVTEIPREKTNQYGIVDIEPGQADAELVRARALVEKPAPDVAPSTLSIIGRYILQPEVFDLLAHQKAGAGGEIQLTDAINALIPTQDVYGFRYQGERFDCGGLSGYVEANVAWALQRPEVAKSLRPRLAAIIKE